MYNSHSMYCITESKQEYLYIQVTKVIEYIKHD